MDPWRAAYLHQGAAVSGGADARGAVLLTQNGSGCLVVVLLMRPAWLLLFVCIQPSCGTPGNCTRFTIRSPAVEHHNLGRRSPSPECATRTPKFERSAWFVMGSVQHCHVHYCKQEISEN